LGHHSGVAGENRNSSISNVYASGVVSSSGGRIGGLVGNNKLGLVINSYSTVNVTGGSETGGLVGVFEAYGENYRAYITNSYASGTVSKANPSDTWSTSFGGLIGSMGWGGWGVVTNSYYNTSVNKDASMADKSSYGLSAGDLTTAAKTNWNASIWDTSGSLPSLKKFIAIPIYGNPVQGISDPAEVPAITYVTYTFAPLAGSYQYQGSAYQLSNLWPSSSIFGSSYASWVANTDYIFTYNNNAVTGFTNAGTYSNIGTNVLKSGYAVASSGNSPGTLNIGQRPITVTADSKTKTYGNTDPTLTYQVTSSSLVGGDSLSGALSRTAGENVGNYTINASALANGNYLITANNGALTIEDNPAISIAQQTAAGAGSPLMFFSPEPSLTGGADGRGQNNTANLGDSAGFVRADGLSASGGLTFVKVSSLPGQGTASAGETSNTGGIGAQMAGVDPYGFVRVLVVNGGINRGKNHDDQ
jgi:hypothetical protein